MIKIYLHEGCYAPILVCDHCSQRIENAGLAVAITCDPTIEHGQFSDVAHAHKGDCHKALEQKFSKIDAYAGWDELSHHLLRLGLNVSLPPEKLKALKASLDEFGM